MIYSVLGFDVAPDFPMNNHYQRNPKVIHSSGENLNDD
jgi:hypothetical protein